MVGSQGVVIQALVDFAAEMYAASNHRRRRVIQQRGHDGRRVHCLRFKGRSKMDEGRERLCYGVLFNRIKFDIKIDKIMCEKSSL